MPEHYFHYTSREFAQSIVSAQRLSPGESGVVYVTTELYDKGADAMNRLAIDGKSVEVVGMIPGALIGALVAGPVYPTRDASGRLWRRGGGTQILFPGELPAAGIKWLALSPP